MRQAVVVDEIIAHGGLLEGVGAIRRKAYVATRPKAEGEGLHQLTPKTDCITLTLIPDWR